MCDVITLLDLLGQRTNIKTFSECYPCEYTHSPSCDRKIMGVP